MTRGKRWEPARTTFVGHGEARVEGRPVGG
jgi:hypothetical protein